MVFLWSVIVDYFLFNLDILFYLGNVLCNWQNSAFSDPLPIDSPITRRVTNFSAAPIEFCPLHLYLKNNLHLLNMLFWLPTWFRHLCAQYSWLSSWCPQIPFFLLLWSRTSHLEKICIISFLNFPTLWLISRKIHTLGDGHIARCSPWSDGVGERLSSAAQHDTASNPGNNTLSV